LNNRQYNNGRRNDTLKLTGYSKKHTSNLAQSQDINRKALRASDLAFKSNVTTNRGFEPVTIYSPGEIPPKMSRPNPAIEQELIEFMDENEQKFINSKMNQNFKFPRKLSQTNPQVQKTEQFPHNLSVQSHRRYKSQENRFSLKANVISDLRIPKAPFQLKIDKNLLRKPRQCSRQSTRQSVRNSVRQSARQSARGKQTNRSIELTNPKNTILTMKNSARIIKRTMPKHNITLDTRHHLFSTNESMNKFVTLEGVPPKNPIKRKNPYSKMLVKNLERAFPFSLNSSKNIKNGNAVNLGKSPQNMLRLVRGDDSIASSHNQTT